jgi:hypothetical protein
MEEMALLICGAGVGVGVTCEFVVCYGICFHVLGWMVNCLFALGLGASCFPCFPCFTLCPCGLDVVGTVLCLGMGYFEFWELARGVLYGVFDFD